MDMPSLDGFVLTALLLRFAFALIAIVLLVRLLPWIDKKNGISFRGEVLETIKTEPGSLALYYGLRFLACAVLIGLVVS